MKYDYNYERETKTRRITIKITEENHTKFKRICVDRKLTQQQLFEEMFELYQKENNIQ